MTILKSIFILLLTTLLFNCSEHSQDTEVSRVNNNIFESQTSTDKSVVRIGPVDATVQTIISLHVDNSLLSNGDINWYINGNREETSKGFRFTSNELKKGDAVQAVVVKDNKEYHSNEIIIRNTPPVITRSELLPRVPRTSSTLHVDIQAHDIDKDNISYKYKWILNGKFISEQSFLDTELKRGDTITVEVTPSDIEDSGKSIRLKSKVFNSLPVVSESSPVFDGKIYKYHLIASDPDGDILDYTLTQGPDGMTIDPASGIITWEVQSDNEVEHEIKVSVSDNHGGEVLVPFTTRISFAKKE